MNVLKRMNHPCGRCLSNVSLIAVFCVSSILMATFLAAAQSARQVRGPARGNRFFILHPWTD
jgi:hypothetical protein